jgi:hypothetical protein
MIAPSRARRLLLPALVLAISPLAIRAQSATPKRITPDDDKFGKQVILLSYPDEAHHLGRRENQKDFQIRMCQFFDHYRKGEPAPVGWSKACRN